MTRNFWKSWLSLTLVLFLTGFLVSYHMAQKGKELAAHQSEEIKKLVTRFNNEIARAKRATADPCAMIFFEFVVPPPDLGGTPKIIMMGNEISYVSIEPSAYFLFPNGEKVELMMMNQPLDQLLTSKKIGEKYHPFSKYCKGR